ncbi:MAG TPA: hypothetical protein VEZ51_10900, partial [Gemmatimonadaceae bacterium]|nr:hypothetical protein [Gemmatimonadaceae bacterium]
MDYRSKNTTGGRLIAARGLLPAILAFHLLGSAQVSAQVQAPLASDPFRPLVLPSPNELRTGSGRPGPRYWQQQVNYKINAILDSAKNEVRGRETIHYMNHSPDAL